MVLSDFFKKKLTPKKKAALSLTKEEAEKSKSAGLKKKKATKRKETVKESKLSKKAKSPKLKKAVKSDVAWKVLEKPHITEKATLLAKNNEYVFRVFKRSNKIEIRQAVKDVYGVDVEGVKIITVPPKRRRLGKTRGWRKAYKKAIVKIRKGQKIEILPH